MGKKAKRIAAAVIAILIVAVMVLSIVASAGLF